MATLDNQFDAEQVEPQGSFDVLPAGVYKLCIVASDVRQTKKGDGTYIWLEFEIMEGEYERRKLFDNVTHTNPNQKAVDIGQRKLSAYCHAVGRLKITDTSELHDVPFFAKVKIKDDPQYGPKNEIVTASKDGNFATAKMEGPAPVKQKPVGAGAGSSGKPPWKR